ncbi:transcription factor [Ganoderma sinense ZZ0214-1]|uniref:Transcription factor n=1 Tax=Ganoderma sinense ZZ0214-1 TaxID=1077348 RepID=A0A2G8RWC0_9APHY|nr:transcription factor [Ganoderma sinense ZZ0214-1]
MKDSAAAEALSHLAQGAFMPGGHPGQFPPHGMHPNQPPLQPMAGEPGPSSHPRGPPNLGDLSAIATALQATAHQAPPPQPEEDSLSAGGGEGSGGEGDKPAPTKTGRRGGRNPTMTNDEWARIRKDNHKEVERRRRGNINEGINELGRIVPNGSGEKAKGAILSRAVQYIHHLKENEARNIEKWTLEKLLMDQAMGDLQAQLEEMRRMWDEERVSRQRAEAELELLRGHGAAAGGSGAAGSGSPTAATANAGAGAADGAASSAGAKENGKRDREDEDEKGEEQVDGEDRSKRPRTD